MCDASFDCDYHAFGGMRDRLDRTNGRVSSIFEPAAAQASVLPPPAVLPPYEQRKSLTEDEESSGETGTETDTDAGEIRNRLFDEVQGFEDLPNINQDGSDGEI